LIVALLSVTAAVFAPAIAATLLCSTAVQAILALVIGGLLGVVTSIDLVALVVPATVSFAVRVAITVLVTLLDVPISLLKAGAFVPDVAAG